MQKIIHRTYKFRLYPNKRQVTELEALLNRCRKVYNRAARAFSRDTSKLDCGFMRTKQAIMYRAQSLRKYTGGLDCPWETAAIAQGRHRARVYWRRKGRGATVGKPRAKTKTRYDAAPAASGTVKLYAKHVQIRDISGNVKAHVHRSIPETAENIQGGFKRHHNKWYLLVVFEQTINPKQSGNNVVGIDLGCKTYATLSNGDKIENPRCYERRDAEIKGFNNQRRSKVTNKSQRVRRKSYEKIEEQADNCMKDFLHKASRKLVNTYDAICVEDLDIKSMRKSAEADEKLIQSIENCRWNIFVKMLTYKAEEAGKRVVKVNPAGTSQRCSSCGAIVPKKLSDRVHRCTHCGLVMDRDQNAAINILHSGAELLHL